MAGAGGGGAYRPVPKHGEWGHDSVYANLRPPSGSPLRNGHGYHDELTYGTYTSPGTSTYTSPGRSHRDMLHSHRTASPGRSYREMNSYRGGSPGRRGDSPDRNGRLHFESSNRDVSPFRQPASARHHRERFHDTSVRPASARFHDGAESDHRVLAMKDARIAALESELAQTQAALKRRQHVDELYRATQVITNMP